MKADSPLLQITDVNKAFGGLHAVSNINLHLNQGETLGIIGPNGSGKTTLFNLITGLIRADSGEVRVAGEGTNLLDMRPWEVFSIGISRTFQNVRLALGQTVLENVMVGDYRESRTSWWTVLVRPGIVSLRDAKMKDKAMEALRFVAPALANTPHRMAGELSYADRRRIELARAIVGSPRIMLIDEPAAGMNARETDEIGEDIRKIRARGISILVIEHKMKFVASVASRIAVLNFGRKIAEGSYEEIRTNPDVLTSYLGRKGDHLAEVKH